MKKHILTISLILFVSHAFHLQAQPDPKARQEAMIISGNTRISVLTPELIRIEWSQAGKFEDHASLAFINRKLEVPKFSVAEENGWLYISTEKLILRYQKKSGKPSPDNLEITLQSDGKTVVWRPGMKDSLNLRGTTRTLDGWNGGNPELLETGLLSQSGWAMVDDSKSLVFDESEWPWAMQRNDTSCVDWYFFGYGHDYKKALFDFTRVAGKIPMPPRFAFGYWWSRYWTYSDTEFRDLIRGMRENKIPIDVLIIDMDWHLTYGLNWDNLKLDPFKQPVGWTGYTWNRALFPNPEEFLKWTDGEKLKTALNLHPASGVPPMEEQYADFAKALNFDTAGKPYIPYEMESKRFARVYFDVLLKPMEQKGIDFWWIDWQQWLQAKKMKGLSNTWWLNYTFFTRMEREGKRPLLFHRWGGLGNHRYQIGFSGDTYTTWKSLDFETYFTPTASNVGYGYWSHDIGGHMPGSRHTDPELFLRWIQFGALSPVLRTHATKSNLTERRIWMFPEHFVAMREALRLRYSLVPYIYTASHQAYETGLSICRPMYYEHPAAPEAYLYQHQYYFGDDMIVAPVSSAVSPDDQLARKRFWLPEGQWFEWSTGFLLEGGKEYYRKYALNEIPLFVKAGKIVPMLPNVTNLQDKSDTLVLTIIPGNNSETIIYEDDGISNDYKTKQYALTKVEHQKTEDGDCLIRIFPVEGSFQGMEEQRSYEIRMLSSFPPEKVMVNGVAYSFSEKAEPLSWTYEGASLTTRIITPMMPKRSLTEFHVSFDEKARSSNKILNGAYGKFNRLSDAIALLKSEAEGDYFLQDKLYKLEQTSRSIQYHPQNAVQELQALMSGYNQLESEISALFYWKSQAPRQALHHLEFDVSQDEINAEKNEESRLSAISKRVKIKNPFDVKYTGGGSAALFDGKKAVADYYDDPWQAYRGVDLEVVYDRGEKKELKSIDCRFLQDIGAWIFLPIQVDYYLSDDGVEFKAASSLKNEVPQTREGAFIQNFPMYFYQRNARFVKIIAKSTGLCPEWHEGKNQKAWLFCDEIIIE